LTNGTADIVKIIKGAQNKAKIIGDMTFHVCSEVFNSAAKAGQPIPMDIFMMQGGAVYQTIDALSDLCEAAKIPFSDEDSKNALGYALADYMQ